MNRYAKELVDIMFGENGPDFGAASDGMLVLQYDASVMFFFKPVSFTVIEIIYCKQENGRKKNL